MLPPQRHRLCPIHRSSRLSEIGEHLSRDKVEVRPRVSLEERVPSLVVRSYTSFLEKTYFISTSYSSCTHFDTTASGIPSIRCRSTAAHRYARTASAPAARPSGAVNTMFIIRANIADTFGRTSRGGTILDTMCATRCFGFHPSPPPRRCA